jgi:predicted permease
MSLLLLWKLLALVAVVGLGWVVGRLRWLGPPQAEPARVLSNAAFFLFAPALLFRTTARVDLAALPWATLAAFFLPTLALMLAVYALGHVQRRRGSGLPLAGPAVRAITATFGNSVQIGIPLAAALFGEAGLALHLALVSLHALLLLTLVTALVELDLARHHAGGSARHVLLGTLRNTVVHPVVLPVLAGLAWNLSGLALPEPLDEVLRILGAAVVPLCLTLIGMSLAYLGWPARLGAAVGLSLAKLVLLPAWVLAVAHGVWGLTGMPLGVVVVLAALPSGSNALMFAQRYRALEAETTAVTLLSTLGLVLSLPVWLALLQAAGWLQWG